MEPVPTAPAGAGTGVPWTILRGVPGGMTCTNVWPRVRTAGAPLVRKNCVGPLTEAFFHVPLTIVPLVAIQAGPVPMLAASRRPFWPGPRSPKRTCMITTFCGATCCLFARSTWGFPPVSRSQVFEARS